jgi:hypothetical protein
MTEQEEKKTSLEYFYDKITSFEYFYDKVLNASDFYQLEYKAFVDSLNEAKIMYEQEIEEAKKEGWRKGYEDAIKFYNQFITK